MKCTSGRSWWVRLHKVNISAYVQAAARVANDGTGDSTTLS
jgi:hypothetical protein